MSAAGPIAHQIVRWLSGSRRWHVPGNPYVMIYGPTFRRLAWWTGLSLPALVVLGVLIDPQLRDWETFREVCLCGAAISFPMGLIWGNEAYRTRVVVDERQIALRSAWLWKREIAWDEVDKVSFNLGPQWFVIRSCDGTKLRVPILMDGIGRFVVDLTNRVPAAKRQAAQSGIALVRADFR